MMLLLEPSLTKNVEITEAMMQAPPMASGYIMMASMPALPAKKIEPSTMVATTVTT